MDENGKFPDYAEVWVNAHRARDVCLALSFALIGAAFTQGWKSLQRQSPSDQEELRQPPGKPAEDADDGRAMPSERQRPIEKAPFDGECV
jgi:hypothetical protein